MTPRNKEFRILLLRGLLGGALGGLVLVATSLFLQFGKFISNYGEWLVIGFLVVGLPLGSFLGGFVGSAIWLVHRQTGRNLGTWSRALLRAVVVVFAWVVMESIAGRSGYLRASWTDTLIFYALLGFGIGGVAGIMVGRQTLREIRNTNGGSV